MSASASESEHVVPPPVNYAERTIVWVKSKSQPWWPAQVERQSDASADVLASRPSAIDASSPFEPLLVRLLGDSPSFHWVADHEDVIDFETGYRNKKPKKNSRPLAAALKEAFAILVEQGVDTEQLKAAAVAAAAAAAVAALSATSMAEVHSSSKASRLVSITPAAAAVVSTGKRKSRTAASPASATPAAAAAATTASAPPPSQPSSAKKGGSKKRAAAVISNNDDDGADASTPDAATPVVKAEAHDDEHVDDNNNKGDAEDDAAAPPPPPSKKSKKRGGRAAPAKKRAESPAPMDADDAVASTATATTVDHTAATDSATITPATTTATRASSPEERNSSSSSPVDAQRIASHDGGDGLHDTTAGASPHGDEAAKSMPPPPVPANGSNGSRRKQLRRKSATDVGHVFESRHDLYKAHVHERAVGVFNGNEVSGAESVILMKAEHTPLRVVRDDGDRIVIEIVCEDASQLSLLVASFETSHTHSKPVRVIRSWTLGSPHAPPFGFRHDGAFAAAPCTDAELAAVKAEQHDDDSGSGRHQGGGGGGTAPTAASPKAKASAKQHGSHAGSSSTHLQWLLTKRQ